MMGRLADLLVYFRRPLASYLALFIHEVVWSELMGGDEAVGLA